MPPFLPSLPSRLRRLASLALLLPSCGLGGCAEDQPLSVLLIVSDTFRSDAVDCERAREHTPNLCALEAAGTRFTRAYTNAPWTLPSVTSLMAGNSAALYARPSPEDPTLLRFRVPESEPLLAEALAARGYLTRHTIENAVAGHARAFQGLEPWRSSETGGADPDPRIGFDGTIRRQQKMIPALAWLATPRLEPFFGLYWFRDPHAPYRPPPKYFERMAPASLPRPAPFYLGLGHGSFPEREERKLRNVVASLGEGELEYLRRLYLTEVRSIDERVGNLLAALDLAGARARTLVVFTSDHGEGFGEHGYYLHGETYHEEVVRVPLILAGPGVAAGARVAAPVSLVDLMPTLAELLEVECLDRPQGRSLVPLLAGRRSAELEGRAHYLVNPIREPGSDAVVWDRYKLISRDADAVLELYDLVADPGERRNLAAAQTLVVERLLRFARGMREQNERRRLEALAIEARAGSPLSAEDEKTLRDLKAIGYVD